MTLDPLAAARLVVDALERLAVPYSIGGSMASSFSGEPRSTLDVDIVADLRASHVDAFTAHLGEAFYCNPESLRRAIERRGSANVIHLATTAKVDLFIAGGTPLDASLLARRRAVVVGDPPVRLYAHSPEDILLQKLRWFRRGGEVSERQWNDVLGLVQVQGGRLDGAYLAAGAEMLGVTDLLARALDRQPYRAPSA